MDFRTFIFQQRTVMQDLVDVVFGRDIKRTVIDAWRYDRAFGGLQILEQEDTLYAVDFYRVSDRVALRMEAPLDRVLEYDKKDLVELEEIAPLLADGEQVRVAGQLGFRLVHRGYAVPLFVNASLLGDGGAAGVRGLLDGPRYQVSGRLIVEEVSREQRDSARYNASGEEPPLMVKPVLLCTMDKGLCGATPPVLQRRDETAYAARSLYELLVGMHDPDRVDLRYEIFTRMVYAEDLEAWFAVQRHYMTINIAPLYANFSCVLRLVCTPLPSPAEYCTGPEDHNSYALFVDYDGVIGYGEARVDGVAYSPWDLQNVSLFDEPTLLEARVLAEHNNLTRRNKISFLTNQI